MEFYVIINDEQQGPYTLDQLAALDITPSTEVWTQGMPDWQQAGDVAALTQLLQQLEYKRRTAAPTPAPATPAPHPPVHEQPQPYVPEERAFTTPREPERTQRRGSHGCLLWSLLVVFVMLAVLVVTVPSRQDHLGAIKDVTREWMGATVEQTGIGGSVLGEMAKWVGGQGADLVIEQMFTYDNYFVCSVGLFNYGTHSKTVSLGVLGHVFTYDKDDINEGLKRAAGLDNSDEPEQEVAPPVQPDEPQTVPDEDPQPQVEDDPQENTTDNPAQELLDSIAARAKREAVRAAKEWAKKKIDEM